jgi:hypothetical protein
MSTALIALACSAFASAASAQGSSRAGAGQQLAEAQVNESNLAGDVSRPYDSRVDQKSVARADGYGPAMPGTSTAGNGPITDMHRATQGDCVGPAGFCMTYFGN